VTAGVLLFLIGLAAGWLAAVFWQDCLDLYDIWREER
jgi:hypothetical protein